jgi:hypothetical protein
MESETFAFRPSCSMKGCNQPARYKAAATWSDGTSRELKNYGLACEQHRDALLSRARAKRQELVVAEGETVGQVGLFELIPGRRDAELPRVSV